MDVYDQSGEGKSTKFHSKFPNRYSVQISKDIQRNGYSAWTKTSSYSTFQKQHDSAQIERLLNMVYCKYPEFHYSQ